MADPAALALQVGVLLKNLIEYGAEVRSARGNITSLCRELSTLRGVLEDLKSHRAGNVADNGVTDCLGNARTIIDELMQRMQPANSRLGRHKQSLTWPFKQKELEQSLARLGRINMAVLMILMGDQHSFVADMHIMKAELRGITDVITNELESQRRKEIAAYLAPASPDAAHAAACSVWDGTSSGEWFVQQLQPWLDDRDPKRRAVVLYGVSGAGKTTIISKYVEHIKALPDGPRLAYFYCTFNDNASQKVGNILGSWLVQLAATMPSILDQFGRAESSKERLPMSALEDVLVQMAQMSGPVLLVLDAINESNDDRKIIDCVTRVLQRSPHIRLLLSSTPYSSHFQPEDIIEMSMLSKDVQGDIAQYVRRVTQSNPVLAQVGEQEIIDVVAPKANGMFRWAECQMTFMSECLTARVARQALKDLPGSLEETYINTLERIPIASKPWVRQALMWLSYAHRPLTLDELAEAVAIEIGQSFMDDSCRIKPPQRLLRLCQGLVAHNITTNTVLLAHSSIKATLESTALRQSPVADFWMDRKLAAPIMIRKLLTYILMKDFGNATCSSKEFRKFFRSYPLLDYASTMWAIHACTHARSGGPFQQEEMQLMLILLANPEDTGAGQHFKFWIRTILGDMSEGNLVQNATPLYYASSYGLAPIVEIMLVNGLVGLGTTKTPSHIDWKSGRYSSTPLQVAAYRGHADVVELLLRHGADPNSRDIEETSCLEWAVSGHHRRVAELLLQYGAECDQHTESPLRQQMLYSSHEKDDSEHDTYVEIPYFGREEISDDSSSDDEGEDEEHALPLRGFCSTSSGLASE
ncbi:Putative P-loop containing nucleoside triphosphate hydrolase [Septoria linicola]|uniref:P-loop containing nucleoside triphosphate hydrolase n=1 Tax=Septoria linicola TaxID=215465 RepID=A0A9Q9ATT1_9PEZI|nr:putative P-loop containing nucleoside triphosphate hydrolase [Septoria linicola]USW55010.1 Putative P-loop containing nucleoside triphosphate hydrolase [Septoria linicola]